MKRMYALILTALLCFSLTACGEQTAAPGQFFPPEEPRERSPQAVVSPVEAPETVPAGDMFTSRDYNTAYSDYVTVLLSDGNSSADGDGVKIRGNIVTITASGTYLFSGTLSEGQIVVSAGDTEKVQLVLDGADIARSGSAALRIESADKVFLTTAYGSENSLVSSGVFADETDEKVDGAIFARSDLTLNGEGSLCVTAENGSGIVTKDDLKICSGTCSVTAGNHGLEGKNSVRISGGELTVNAGNDGIHSDHTDADKGYVYICGGSVSIRAEDDAIHAESELTVTGGSIRAEKCSEGLEALVINISGGEISVVSSDDGLNASGGSSTETPQGFAGKQPGDPFAAQEGAGIFISGGTLTVHADGDGLDSNGCIEVSGGEVYISGPTDGGNGALDYASYGSISGGTVVAACAAGMAENFGSGSTQGAILLRLDSTQRAGAAVTVTDGSGAELAAYVPEKDYQVVVVSAPGMEPGGSYTVRCGTESHTVELTSTVYSSGGEGSGGMGTPGGEGFGGMQAPGGEGFGGGTPPSMPEREPGEGREGRGGDEPPDGFRGRG